MKYRLEVTEPAEKDLLDIVRYISSQISSPISAIQMMELFEEAILSLAESPERCPLIADERLSHLRYRKLIVKNYIIFFSINEKERIVDIERILYARRNWLRFI